MKHVVEQLLNLINKSKQELLTLSDEEWNYQRAPNKWTKKEILGHLIDSAANNHQRFVRVQFEENPQITYDQNNWVKYQNYKNNEIKNLIEFWFLYNQHIAYVIKNIPESNYENKCDVNKEELVTLEWLVTDYINHLEYHLNQIIRNIY